MLQSVVVLETLERGLFLGLGEVTLARDERSSRSGAEVLFLDTDRPFEFGLGFRVIQVRGRVGKAGRKDNEKAGREAGGKGEEREEDEPAGRENRQGREGGGEGEGAEKKDGS